MSPSSFAPFEPRPVDFLGLREARGFRLKLYSVVYGGGRLDLPRFERALPMLEDALPQPAETEGRPGLGFAIFHQGRSGDYAVLGWWDNENELPTRVFVREGEQWRGANERESFCVWDLEVVWTERQAYVETMLAGPEGGGVEAYLSRRITTAPRH